MHVQTFMTAIHEGLLLLVPWFRMVWAVTVALGAAMLITALILKKNPVRKKSPWIVGGMGLLMMISSGTQLMTSFF